MGFRLGFRLIFSFLFLTLWTTQSFSQCLDIETIFVDSCDDSGDEGFNEMVAFNSGPSALNTATMNVNWPSQSWQGLVQDAFTTTKVNALNSQVAALGGCGRFLQPVGGIIPANSKVILITSQNFSLTANVFGAITQNIYILFQDNTTVPNGHFGNYGATSSMRTLTISFGACSDTVSYDRSLLVDANGLPGAANGATVNFTSAGTASYTNEGCVAPVDVFSVEAGVPISACPGATVSLSGTAQGQTSVSWTAASGSFANSTSLSTNYTLPFSASGSVTLTLSATNSCGNSISDTVVITVNSAVVPNFTQVLPICSGGPLSALPTTSNNGITGTWSPPIDNTQTQTYNFSPTVGQCASGTTMTITVNNPGIISITNNNPACNISSLSWVNWTNVNANTAQGTVGSIQINVTHSVGGLSTTSGVYNGSVFPPQYTVPVSTTALRNDLAGVFTFCFDSPVTNPQVAFASIGQAGVPVQINTSVPYIVTWTGLATTYPNNQSLIGSEGYTIITFPGTHSCIQFDYLQNESYCNLAFGIQDVNCQISPICVGDSLTLVAHGASNYVWTPATDLNTNIGSTVIASPSTTTTYQVTDTTGCYLPGEITVTVNPSIAPDFANNLTICSGNPAPVLNATSPNGISGVWSPSVISNTASGNYVFTPNPGQCATNFTLSVTVTSANIVPDFAPSLTICSGNTPPVLTATSPNGISGVWSPSVISNTASGNYVFTPNPGQCATNFTLSVTVTSANIVPDFAPSLTICSGNTAPVLNATSPNGISGVWSPSVISNTASGNYVFTPNPGQCATNFTLSVTVTSANIVPDFAPSLTLCSGNPAPVLNATSPNGISGVWSPSVISNTANGNYVFTPNPGQCTTNFTLSVTVTSASIVPDFNTLINVCSGTPPPVLAATSPNGITGVWSPATINNTVGNNYVFTPLPGQCGTILTIAVTITPPSIIPTFNPVAPICVGDVLLPLPTTSTNGITGSWSPALDNTQNQTYTFTPDAGQCALNATLAISVNPPSVVPTFATTNLTICSGDSLSPLPTTATNGITGIWSPALSNTQSQTYTFTPNAGQCARNALFTINVTQKTVPPFSSLGAVCAGTILAPLPTTSLNGISGTWSPALDNTQTRTYTFTPNAGQCATTATITQTINPATLPVFGLVAPVCSGTLLNPLPTVSVNGISGSWSPTFNNLLSQNYIFTPNPGQCATNGNLSIDVAPNPAYAETAYICLDSNNQLIRPATIDSHLSAADYTFIWTQDGNPLTDVTPSIQASQTGIYEMVATHRITGCTLTITTTVLATPSVIASAYVNEDFADQQQIIVNVTGGSGDFLYQLNYGPYQPNNIFPIDKGGDYTIHVKDVSGCNNLELKVTALNYPKYFTPNDDGYHDTWNVQGMQPSQKGLITIFDRYGKLLKQFRTTADGWDGTFNDRPLPATDYWFVIDYQTLSGTSRTFRAHFSLKR